MRRPSDIETGESSDAQSIVATGWRKVLQSTSLATEQHCIRALFALAKPVRDDALILRRYYPTRATLECSAVAARSREVAHSSNRRDARGRGLLDCVPLFRDNILDA